MDLRKLLNDHRWHTQDLATLRIVVRHRGAPDDERALSGASILEIAGNGVFVEARDADGEPIDDGRAFIPYHRFLRVRGPEGLLYERKEKEEP
jgi:uncharacterized protein (UPF0248 family)